MAKSQVLLLLGKSDACNYNKGKGCISEVRNQDVIFFSTPSLFIPWILFMDPLEEGGNTNLRLKSCFKVSTACLLSYLPFSLWSTIPQISVECQVGIRVSKLLYSGFYPDGPGSLFSPKSPVFPQIPSPYCSTFVHLQAPNHSLLGTLSLVGFCSILLYGCDSVPFKTSQW